MELEWNLVQLHEQLAGNSISDLCNRDEWNHEVYDWDGKWNW